MRVQGFEQVGTAALGRPRFFNINGADAILTPLGEQARPDEGGMFPHYAGRLCQRESSINQGLSWQIERRLGLRGAGAIWFLHNIRKVHF